MIDICRPFISTMIFIEKCGEDTIVNGTYLLVLAAL
jgi:hypothetical protein